VGGIEADGECTKKGEALGDADRDRERLRKSKGKGHLTTDLGSATCHSGGSGRWGE